MSNIDKQTLRDIAAAAKSTPLWHAVGVFGEVVDPANPEWKPVHDFCKTFTAERVLALLDELEAEDKRIADLRETLLAARSHVMQCARLGDAHANGVLQAIDRAAAGKGAS